MSTGNTSMGEKAIERVATRFAELWSAITHDGDKPLPVQESRILLDRVRAALDRGLARLDTSSPAYGFVADTFLIEELVYDGNRTQIQRVRHRDLGTVYALKSLPPSHADDAVGAEFMLREAHRHLSIRNPYIVTAYMALRLPDGRPALLIEWMDGGNLSQRLNGANFFSAGDIQIMMDRLVSGLRAIHTAGFVHADITPANLLFANDDPRSLRIADLGIALEGETGDTDSDRLARTRSPLSSPECLAGRSPDERSDLHACGQILSLLLERCKDDGTAAVAALGALAQHLTCDDPDDRPQSADATLALLQAIDA